MAAEIHVACYAAALDVLANIMSKKIFPFLFFLVLFFFRVADTFAATLENPYSYPFYVGVEGGYGSTTWEGLVPSKENRNFALDMSTPVFVTEGGAVWGIFAGYELIPYFAVEANYMRYPNAKISFASDSLFAFDHHDLTNLNTHTETISVMAKIMLIIPHTAIRAYSSLGPAGIHRYDQMNDHWRVSPNFGAGFNYNFTPHIMAELGANYTSGYGESELNPAQDYMPFLYSVFLRIAYRF